MISSPRPTLILGIDPGYGRIGYGLIEVVGSSTRCVEYGCITTDSKASFPARLHSLHRDLTAIITRTTPHLMAVEKLFFVKNVTTGIDVGQARGVILLTARLHDVPIIELTPLQAKQAIAGYGHADKKQVQHMVSLILGLAKPPTPDDAADALALAISASNMRIPLQ